jgi:hypothetical protein
MAQIFNPRFSILYNLLIYEYTDKIFDLKYLNNAILTDKLLTININLYLIKFYKISEDFSFDVSYEIKNITNNITVHFDNLNELDLFKYLFYEEKSFLYDNKTFEQYIKYHILNILISKMKNGLIYYPECDSLEYFKRVIDYGLIKTFYVNYYCKNTQKIIDFASITSYNYNKIIKNDTHLLLKDIKFDLKLSFLGDMYIEYYDEDVAVVTLKLENITISRNKNYTISYGIADDKCNLEIFTNITKRAIDLIRI